MQVQIFNKPLLEAKGFTVRPAMTLREAREAIELEMPELVILDIRLPDGNGLDFLRELRKTSAVPVIALTNNSEEIDIINGLSSGCDDYVPKPYTFPLLYARIEALLRRSSSVPEVIQKSSLRLDVVSGQAFLNDGDLLLTQKEFALLLLFVQNGEKTMSAEYLYEKVWKKPIKNDKNALQVTVSKLRKKIEPSGYNIATSRGQGYKFEKN